MIRQLIISIRTTATWLLAARDSLTNEFFHLLNWRQSKMPLRQKREKKNRLKCR